MRLNVPTVSPRAVLPRLVRRALVGLAVPMICLTGLLLGCGGPPPSAASQREAVQTALQPMMEAIGRLGRSQEEDRDRLRIVVTELDRMSALVAGLSEGPGPVRMQVEELQRRMQQLNEDFDAARARHASDQTLMIDALDRTVDRLDALLRQLEPGPAGSKPEKDAGAGSELRSDALRYGLILFLLACLVALLRWFHRARKGPPPRVADETLAVIEQPEEAPDQEVTVAVPESPVALPQGPEKPCPEPLVTTVELTLRDPLWLKERLRLLLLSRREVLMVPAPGFVMQEGRLQITFATMPEEGAAARVEAELLAAALEHAGRARHSDSPAA